MRDNGTLAARVGRISYRLQAREPSVHQAAIMSGESGVWLCFLFPKEF